MTTLACLIVDDEPLARQVLRSYVADYPSLALVGECGSAFEAMECLHHQSVDILLLDIHMPGLDGISLVESLERPPAVIFTTAYDHYAVKGFELDAVDYLLKPISFPRFAKAVQKAYDRCLLGHACQHPSSHLSLKVDKKHYRLPYAQIRYIQAASDFVKVFTTERCLVATGTLKALAFQLPEQQFLRIHKSYIVSLSKVAYMEGNRLNIGNEFLPIGSAYREQILEAITK